MLTVIFAIVAAACNALASVLQRAAARDVPQSETFRLAMLASLIRRPVWLAGMLGLTGGFVFQALALEGGSLALVQPVLVAELPLTLVFAAVVFRGRVEWRALGAAMGMSAGLAALLAAAAPGGGRTGVDVLPVVFVTLLAAGAIAFLVSVSLRVSGNLRATLLGIAAGIGFALTAALMKAATEDIPRGFVAVVSSWPVWGMVCAGLISLFLWQNALQAGSLVAAQPAIVFSDPIVGIVLGVYLFGESIRFGWFLAPEIIGGAVIVAASLELARSPLVSGAQDGADALPGRETPGREPVKSAAHRPDGLLQRPHGGKDR